MSYDIELLDPVTRNVIELDSTHQMRGGTYAIGGSNRAELNITYNYAPHFYRHLDSESGIRSIYGKTGAETIPALESAAGKLGDDVDDDYWRPAEGNAKRALLQLIAMAKLRPDGVWAGD
jgi:hypothetical protein